MDQVARFKPQDRSDLFRAAAEERGVFASIIEKDFWVCWVLRRIYTLPNLPVELHFKGGTSLSKVFGVIERMSEDVDLVIDRRGLGFTGENDPAAPGLSNKARQRLVRQIKESACKSLHDVVKPALERAFSDALGVAPGSTGWKIILADDGRDEQTILFEYPTIEPPSEYMRAMVRLEFGARGDPWPSVKGTIRPYAADVFPNQFADPDTNLRFVVACERTFWEKVTILHMLHHKPPGKVFCQRPARHYYDVFRLAQHELGRKAIGDVRLLARVVEHMMLFFPCGWAQYHLAKPGSLKLAPPGHLLEELRDDYKEMAEQMIFGEVPEFDAVLEGLQEIEISLNQPAGT